MFKWLFTFIRENYLSHLFLKIWQQISSKFIKVWGELCPNNVHVTANVIHIMKRKYMRLRWLEFLCECWTRYLSSEILSRKLLEKFHIYTSSCIILNFVNYIKLRGLYCMKKALDWEWLMHCHHSSTWQSGIKDKWCVSSWLGI